MCGAFSGSCSLQCDRCLSSCVRGGSWLGRQVLLAISVVSVLELASNSRNFGMS